jgi:predicted GIY-YIG superfamily endonuclease
MWYFYILQSLKNPNWFYKGSTGDLRDRVRRHAEGEVDATRPYRPLRLVYYEAYISEKTARMRESKVKQSGSVSVPLLRRIKDSLET